jgi:hypothetical protein
MPSDGDDKPAGTRTRKLSEALSSLKSRKSGIDVDVSDSAKMLASGRLSRSKKGAPNLVVFGSLTKEFNGRRILRVESIRPPRPRG